MNPNPHLRDLYTLYSQPVSFLADHGNHSSNRRNLKTPNARRHRIVGPCWQRFSDSMSVSW